MATSAASSSARPASPRAYLDYAAFAPVDPRVAAVMRPFLEGGVGNPSAPHALGAEARDGLDGARLKLGRLVGGDPAGVVFTASATEANNLALLGTGGRAAAGHLIVSAVEHVSVLTASRELARRGWEVTVVPVDRDGTVDPDDVQAALRPDTALVSIGAANGEIGTVQAVREIGRRLAGRGPRLHVDAVGAVGRVPLGVGEAGIDLLTLSSNDLCGPPGVGALWVRPGVSLAAFVLGGAQERGLRAGTENVPGIVGFGVAAELARAEGPAEAARVTALRDRLLDGLVAALPEARVTGPRGARRLPQHVSVAVAGVKADAVLLELDAGGVTAGTGSPCAAALEGPSHVLAAIGCDPRAMAGALCFTLGRWSVAADVERVLELVPRAVRRLRALAG